MRKRLLALVLCAAMVSPITVTLVVSAREASGLGTLGIDVAGFFTSLHGSTPTAQQLSVSGADLAVSIDYKRDVNDGFGYKTKDDKTVYGADTVIYTITAANNRPKDATNVKVTDSLPSGLKFVSALQSQGAYNAQSGVWNVGNLNAGTQATLQLKAKVIQSGDIENKAALPADSDNSNNLATATFTAHNPVILVHGFDDTFKGMQYILLWTPLMHRLETEGIRFYAFDYSPGSQDPYVVASTLFEPWINHKRAELGYGGATYTGKFDIVCHSMGALVTRFYMEGSQAHAQSIGQWIGVGPANQGAALADIYHHPELAKQLNVDPKTMSKIFNGLETVLQIPMDSPAVFNMQTTDPEILALNARFTSNGANYKIIEGTGATLGGVRAVEKTATGQYQFTLLGDGLLANAQSELPGVPVFKANGVNHIALIADSTVIAKVIEYIET